MRANNKIRPVWMVSKIGVIPLMGVYPWNWVRTIHFQARNEAHAGTQGRRHRKLDGLNLQEKRHSFAIETLPKPGRFASRPYLYMCVRCKWTFRVNDAPGSIVAIDLNGQPLPEPENSPRAATFAVGPCPALKTITARKSIPMPRPRWFTRARYHAARRMLLLWRRRTEAFDRDLS
jgi:hypothetical protein